MALINKRNCSLHPSAPFTIAIVRQKNQWRRVLHHHTGGYEIAVAALNTDRKPHCGVQGVDSLRQ